MQVSSVRTKDVNFESSMVSCPEKADFGKGQKKSERQILAISLLAKCHLISEYVLNPESFAFTTQKAP